MPRQRIPRLPVAHRLGVVQLPLGLFVGLHLIPGSKPVQGEPTAPVALAIRRRAA